MTERLIGCLFTSLVKRRSMQGKPILAIVAHVGVARPCIYPHCNCCAAAEAGRPYRGWQK